MPNVVKIIKQSFENLKNTRFFVSEADFQHSLAVELEKSFADYPEMQVFLEFPVMKDGQKIYVDIMVLDNNHKKLWPIELKYKTLSIPSGTKFLNTNISVNQILKNQSAQDLGGYDFWKDINRIEYLVDKGIAVSGVCIFITNDKYYVDGKYSKQTQAFNFRLGKELHKAGNRDWKNVDAELSPSYIKKHPGFRIKNNYNFVWQSFFTFNEDVKNNRFDALFVEIPPKTK